MSTNRSIRNIRRSIGTVVLTLLGGLALQFVLPAVAFAAHTRLAPNPSSDAVARAEVSVVRILVIYKPLPSQQLPTTIVPGFGKTPVPSPVTSQVECTGLGILVGSWSVKGTNSAPYVNWVLTDPALVNPSTPVCAQNPAPVFSLASIDVLANDAYTNTNPSDPQALQHVLTLGSLLCQGTTTSCQSSGVTSTFLPPFGNVNGSAILFSFLSNFPQPFEVFATQDQTPDFAIRLTDASNKSSLLPLSARNLPQSYLKPVAVLLSQTTASTPTTSQQNVEEPGTPSVNAAGQVVSIGTSSLSGSLSVTQANTLLQKQSPLPTPSQRTKTSLHTNQLQDAWNAGIEDFYGVSPLTQPDHAAATQEFALATKANPAFQAPAMFTNGNGFGQASPTPATTPTSVPTSTVSRPSSFFGNPLLLPGIGLLGLIILLVGIGLLIRARAHRREMERFNEEQARAQRIAELEVQRQQQALQPQAASAAAVMASTPPPRPTSLPCPHCGQPVRFDAPYCSNCHSVFSQSPSGHLVARPPTAAEAPTSPLLSTVPQSSPQDNLSFSDMPTLRIPQDGQEDTAKRQPYTVEQLTGHNLSLAVGTRSDPGIKRKYKPNEDSLLAVQGARPQNAQLQQFGLFVVADGMGGHANGQDASRLAIQTIINYMVPPLSEGKDTGDEDFVKLLADGVQQANQAVHQHNQEQRGDMGTTMTATLVIGSMAYVANVGDSRTYLYREPGGLSKVTRDHSVVASLVDAGVIKPDDIYTHPKRNQIYRSLGEKPVVEVDTFKVPLQPGDKLLLCSDGLWDMVRDPDIQRLMRSPIPDPSQTGDALIKAALDGGGEDNVSVIVVQITEASQQTGVAGIQLLAKPDSVVVPNMAK
jgi:serine/threonine protein phosphatase PrpC